MFVKRLLDCLYKQMLMVLTARVASNSDEKKLCLSGVSCVTVLVSIYVSLPEVTKRDGQPLAPPGDLRFPLDPCSFLSVLFSKLCFSSPSRFFLEVAGGHHLLVRHSGA
jgi:hypothetical protein